MVDENRVVAQATSGYCVPDFRKAFVAIRSFPDLLKTDIGGLE